VRSGEPKGPPEYYPLSQTHQCSYSCRHVACAAMRCAGAGGRRLPSSWHRCTIRRVRANNRACRPRRGRPSRAPRHTPYRAAPSLHAGRALLALNCLHEHVHIVLGGRHRALPPPPSPPPTSSSPDDMPAMPPPAKATRPPAPPPRKEGVGPLSQPWRSGCLAAR